MNDFLPVRIEKTKSRELVIEWSDGVTQTIPFRTLRDGCRCATCMEKQTKDANKTDTSALPVLSNLEAQPVDIVQMEPLGNYAYNIHFSDGHSTGIFTLEQLRSFS